MEGAVTFLPMRSMLINMMPFAPLAIAHIGCRLISGYYCPCDPDKAPPFGVSPRVVALLIGAIVSEL